MPLSILEKERVHRDNLVWLLVAQACAILPLLFYLPLWLVFFWLCAILWRIQIHRMKWVSPNLLAKGLLCIFCIAAIYVSFHGAHSVEPMISFLLCAFVLKTVELHSKKDALILLFIGFITIACQFLFAQTMAAAVYGSFSLIVLLSAWQAAFFSKKLSVKKCLKKGGLLVFQSLPFMLVLFLIMPRLGPLWSVPIPQGQGKTGFSDILRMGDIGNLVQSSEVAFRVSFEGAPPSLDQFYWRGLVLDYFDGFQWRSYDNKPNRPLLVASEDMTLGQSVDVYSIVMEPHSYRWLFSLQTPLAVSSSQLKVLMNSDDILFASQPVTQTSEYTVVSSRSGSSARAQTLQNDHWERLTRLPAMGNERSKQLARAWRRETTQPEEIVKYALAYFSKAFSYTLQPTVLESNAVDQFLFETKNGFCEHYASSFVFLMRSAGVPARIVLGYQGAAFNNVENYFTVKQSDAHAWAEVWIDGRWQVIDPTSAVAPSRVSQGIEQALNETDLKYLNRSIWQGEVLRGLYQRWDAMGYAWNRWVLNYDNKDQQSVFEKILGSSSPWRVGLAFVSLCGFIFSVYVWFQQRSKYKKPQSAEMRLIKPLLRRLEKQGIVRKPSETITEFAQRLYAENPDIGESFSAVAKAYVLAAYEGGEKNYELLSRVVKSKKIG